MSTLEKGRDALKMFEAALRGIEVIDSLTGGKLADATGTNQYVDVIHGVRAVIQSLREGFDGKTTPDVILDELKAMQASLRDNDATVDAELRAKFPTENTP